ncbi:MAG TPA: hypothetical protein DHW71_06885 [Gammaproteobacteria bacterium]|nr:hypothetical protein [Gammaproteobacteria bacterium]HBF07999.1 hypothetical protein [Gammaproteobacteria bacterium]HCK92691.1 hypothetical protein [Gammaproteobacteria bacterium]|tara:strand:- start:10058 stop:10276 length:219 start_codon:yes stop_codon:yes gene_type:complete
MKKKMLIFGGLCLLAFAAYMHFIHSLAKSLGIERHILTSADILEGLVFSLIVSSVLYGFGVGIRKIFKSISK